MQFDELGLDESVLDGVRAMNFKECTPIQEQTIPLILAGQDVLASAQTGTGKTAAYLLPLINQLTVKPHPEDKVNAIIMAPTRELALQIDRLMEGFGYFLPVSAIAVYGGNDGSAYEQQKQGLKLGGDIVIATPGRLLSHLRMDNVDLTHVQYFILDEADRMLDMGFYEDIMEVLSFVPKERQTIMFSATYPPKIETLAKTIMNNPTMIKIAVSKPAEGITQGAFVLEEHHKLPLATQLLTVQKGFKSIVFASSKDKVKELYRALVRKKVNAEQMHSDLTQDEREQVMLDFKNGKLDVLVATDILSRGIDIDDIKLVINYDVPRQPEDYVHRVGRTARAGAEGEALTFVSIDDQGRFGAIERFIEKEVDKRVLPAEFGESPKYDPNAPVSRGFGGKGKSGGRMQQKGKPSDDKRRSTQNKQQPKSEVRKPSLFEKPVKAIIE